MSLPLLVRSNGGPKSSALLSTSARGRPASSVCLGTTELFDLILRAVYGEGEGKGSVASWTVVSKAFHSGAVAVLWEAMDTLVPLLNLISDEVWQYVKEEPSPCSTWAVILEIRDPSLRTAEWYGRHIKRVNWNRDVGEEVPQNATIMLLGHLPDGFSLLPNVRSFACSEHNPITESTLLISRFFARSLLQELVLDVALDEKPTSYVLPTVQKQCPLLKTLRLIGNSDAPLHAAVSTALTSLIRYAAIVEFSCTSPLSDEVLLAVARSTSLRHVDIKVDRCTLDNVAISALPSGCFASVQDLSVRFAALDLSSLSLLEKIGSEQLANLSLHVTSQVSGGDDLLSKHLEVLTKALYTATIRKVELHALRMDSENETSQGHTITLKTFQPLFKLKQLTHLVVYAKRFALTSQDVRSIACAFPNVETLELMPTAISGEEPTVDALQYLAELCPNLTLMALPIRVPFGVPTVRPGWRSQSRVTMYTITTAAELSGDPRISAYIAALFPATNTDKSYDAADITEEVKETYVEELRPSRTPGESMSSAYSHAESWAQTHA